MDLLIIFLIIFIVLLVVGLIIGLIVYFLLRRREEEEPVPPKPPVNENPEEPEFEPCPKVPGFSSCATIDINGMIFNIYPFTGKAFRYADSNLYINFGRNGINTSSIKSNEWSYNQLSISNSIGGQCMRLFGNDTDLGQCDMLRNQDLWIFDGYNFYNYQSVSVGIIARLEFDYISNEFYLSVVRQEEIGQKILGTITVV